MGEKILVIDNREISRDLRESLLHPVLGYQERGRDKRRRIRHIDDTLKAAKLIGNGYRPDTIISDIYRHAMSGTDFAKWYRSCYGDGARIYLRSAYYGGDERETGEINRLYMDGIIDGFAPKIPGHEDGVLLDLLASPHFMLFAGKYGLSFIQEMENGEIARMAEIDIRRRYGLELRFQID